MEVAGQSYLYGFVEYEDPMAAQRAIEAMVFVTHPLLSFIH